MMGGDIRIESAPGLGATFVLAGSAPQRALPEACAARGQAEVAAAARGQRSGLAAAPVADPGGDGHCRDKARHEQAWWRTSPPRGSSTPRRRAMAWDSDRSSLYRRQALRTRGCSWPIGRSSFARRAGWDSPSRRAGLADDLAGIAATIGAQPLSDAARDLEQRDARRRGRAPKLDPAWSIPAPERLQQVAQALSRAFDAETRGDERVIRLARQGRDDRTGAPRRKKARYSGAFQTPDRSPLPEGARGSGTFNRRFALG